MNNNMKKEMLLEIDEELKQLKEDIESKKAEIEKKQEEIEDLEDWEMDEEEFDDSLRGIYGDNVQIGFINVDLPRAIRELDEIAYNMAKSEESDVIRGDKKDDLENELSELEAELEDLKEEYENVGKE